MIVLAVTFPHAGFLQIHEVIGLASRTTHDAIWPAKLSHELAAVLIVLKVDQRFLKGGGFHESSMPDYHWSVKYIVTLIFHAKHVGINCFLSRNAFQSGKHAPVVVLISLKGRAALVARVVPCKTDEMLLGFG